MAGISRRKFLQSLAIGGAAIGTGGSLTWDLLQTAGAAAAAVGKDTLVIVNLGDAVTLDPAKAADTATLTPLRGPYEGLVTMKGATFEIAPQLATSWTSTPDARRWTFKLRRGVRFHDGTPLTSEAVKLTLERLFAINQGFAYAFSGVVASVDTPDPLTVRFNLSQPDPRFLAKLAALASPRIVSPAALRERAKGKDYAQDWFNSHAAGTGPYMLERWDRGQQIILRRFPEYWGGWAGPHVGRVIFKIVKEASTQRLLLERGEADATWVLDWDVIDALARRPGIRIHESQTTQTFYLSMNCQREPLNDVRIRQALSYAFDYEGARQAIFNGRIDPLYGPLPPIDPAHLQREDWPYSQDLNKARDLLGRSTYPNGGFTLTCDIAEGFSWFQTAVQILQANLRPLNITVKVRQAPPAALFPTLGKAETAAHLIPATNVQLYADPAGMLIDQYSKAAWGLAGWNFAFYANDRVEEMLKIASASPSGPRRIAMVKDIQRIIVADAPYILIGNPPARYPLRANVRGFVYNPWAIDTFDLYAMYKT